MKDIDGREVARRGKRAGPEGSLINQKKLHIKNIINADLACCTLDA